MKLVVIESPYSGDIPRNLRYLHYCMLDSISYNEAPFAAHLMYPQILDEHVKVERALGINMGLEWAYKAQERVFYEDLGWSSGMRAAHDHYKDMGLSCSERRLPPDLLQRFLAGDITYGTKGHSHASL